jgi:2-desacetyl-2-hydroxyethyl bacteriochlorophyllide A dehydrogenase
MNVPDLSAGALKRCVTSRIPTDIGDFQLRLYLDDRDKKEHVALVLGEVESKSGILARVHSECFTGEVLGSHRCDCREQLALAMQKIAEEGCGVLVYLRQEGRGIGLADKLRAYNLQDQGYDTVDANLLLGHQPDERDYMAAAQIFEDLRIRSIRLLTNNPRKIESLRALGIRLEGQLPLRPTVNESNFRYLLTKALRMDHLLDVQLFPPQIRDHTRPTNRYRGESIATRPYIEQLNAKELLANRALYFTNPRQVSVREEALPDIGGQQVLVQTALSAISSGTESLIYRGEFPEEIALDENIAELSGAFAYPLKYGYSVVGRVAGVGAEVSREWEDRVVLAFHPHESHFVANPDTLLPLPEGISKEDAAFLPNMETAVNFLMDGTPLIGENVTVFGQGIVGLLTTGLLARFPLAGLLTVDQHPLRRQVSQELGAKACSSPEETDLQTALQECMPDGADLTYEVSGSPAALDQALHATGFGGRIVIGSWYGSKRANLNLGGRFHRSRIRLISSQVSSIAPELDGRWTKNRRIDVAWEMIRQLKPSRLITHRFPIDRAADAYQLLDRNPGETVQILLTY